MERCEFSGTIIVADRSKIDRQYIRDFFSNNNYTVFEAISEERVREILDTHTIDLIMMDASISSKNTYTSIRSIRQITNAPIVATNDTGNDNLRKSCFDAGADDYIEKPYDFNDLGVRIPAYIRRYNELGTKNNVLRKIKIGQWTFDLDKARLCSEQGNDCALTLQECRLFERLAKSQGQIITRNQQEFFRPRAKP